MTKQLPMVVERGDALLVRLAIEWRRAERRQAALGLTIQCEWESPAEYHDGRQTHPGVSRCHENEEADPDAEWCEPCTRWRDFYVPAQKSRANAAKRLRRALDKVLL